MRNILLSQAKTYFPSFDDFEKSFDHSISWTKHVEMKVRKLSIMGNSQSTTVRFDDFKYYFLFLKLFLTTFSFLSLILTFQGKNL